ncbi:3-dehydroquinate synthase [Commensalibacter sp. Nvir]|uniref:3-dehydroquinate synthase n=1 Tax=Commensalibacter sp. Nvir TaxID=3069817 RepID=UPI002D5C8C17|nr:3-dehydroquinate synthase [Commensalibacter sp. Nvir]
MPDNQNAVQLRPISLVGLMGAGKTTLGKKLANHFNIPFVDSDIEIEKTAGCSIADIFELYGEKEFRRLEYQVIRRLLMDQPIVLATGGGAFIHTKTRNLLKEKTRTIWLHCELDIILQRIAHHTHRPLLNSGDKKDILSSLMSERYPIYAEAELTIPCQQSKIELTLDKIIFTLENSDKMYTLPVDLPGSPYNIHIGTHILEQAGSLLYPLLSVKKVYILVDETVAAYHLDTLTTSLRATQISTEIFVIPSGESTKSLKHYEDLTHKLLEKKIERQTPIIAFGGGVTGDLGGFIASTILRGVPFIQMPTTLLSQVDSSVGGKTGINTAFGKNLLGTFYQPLIVISDTHLLRTLPKRELKAGYAEIVKAGLINDPLLFKWCETYGSSLLEYDPNLLSQAVQKACSFKTDIVLQDQFERNAKGRNLLNLGHSLGHIIEAELGYNGCILHGEAVALGCCLIFKLCTQMNCCPPEDTERVVNHFRSVGLPVSLQDLKTPLHASKLMSHLLHDKKIKNGKVSFVLVNGIGKTFISQEVKEKELLLLLRENGAQ